LNGQCETCAFNRKGSGGAASESPNRLKGLLSAYGLLPFFCHHDRNGDEYDWQNPKSLGPLQLAPDKRKICGGWQRYVARLNTRGFFNFGVESSHTDLPLLRHHQKQLASDAIRQLETFLACPSDGPQKDIERGRLVDIINAVRGRP